MKRRNSTLTFASSSQSPHWLGFDLDMTMIRYKIKPLAHHIFDAAKRYMVEDLGYPKSLLGLPYSMSALLRGVLLDKTLGNLISIDDERRVRVAYHGTRKMTEEEISKTYPDPVDFIGLQSFRYWSCSSQFEIPYIYIAQQLILDIDEGRLVYPLQADLKKETPVETQQQAPSSAPDIEQLYGPQLASELHLVANSKYARLTEDLHATINYNFGNFEDGHYFKPFHKPDLSDFIFQRTDLIPHLKHLRESGVRLFLMTNSNHHYTNVLMRYAYGADWRSLFDLIIYRSKKPQFFLLNTPFSCITDATLPGETKGVREMDDSEPLQLGGEYYGGNLRKLKNDLLGDSEVTYVGDELFGDVVAPASYAQWATIAVVEELQEAEELAGWKHPKSEIRLEQTAANLSLSNWGNYFICAGQPTRLTFYGALMHHFADVAIPCVSRLAHFEAGDLFLPHHPHAQEGATRDSDLKHRTTVDVTSGASGHLPDNFNVPNKEAMLRNGDLLKSLKELRATPPTTQAK